MEYSNYIKKFYNKLESKSDLDDLDSKILHNDSLLEDDRSILQKELLVSAKNSLGK